MQVLRLTSGLAGEPEPVEDGPGRDASQDRADDAKNTIDLFKTMRMRAGPTDKVGRCEAAFILAVD